MADFYEALELIIDTTRTSKHAWPFVDPVSRDVHGYYDLIKQPMDLRRLRTKVQFREYRSLIELEKDFQLLVNNCENFNGPKSTYTKMAQKLWKSFRRNVRLYLQRDLSMDEYETFVYPPPRPPPPPPPPPIVREERGEKESKPIDINVFHQSPQRQLVERSNHQKQHEQPVTEINFINSCPNVKIEIQSTSKQVNHTSSPPREPTVIQDHNIHYQVKLELPRDEKPAIVDGLKSVSEPQEDIQVEIVFDDNFVESNLEQANTMGEISADVKPATCENQTTESST